MVHGVPSAKIPNLQQPQRCLAVAATPSPDIEESMRAASDSMGGVGLAMQHAEGYVWCDAGFSEG